MLRNNQQFCAIGGSRAFLLLASVWCVLAGPVAVANAAATRSETVGGVASTWTNYHKASGKAGPKIKAYETVQVACRVKGFKVADGNVWWYRVASRPWSGAYYVSADAFYNNGKTHGPLKGTPFFDPKVPIC